MCKLCDEGNPQDHDNSRRDFLKTATATGAAASGLFAARGASADSGDKPGDSGRPGRRLLIRGGAVMSMDPDVGDFAQADVLIEGAKILAVGPNLRANGAAVIDARAGSSCRASSTRITINSRLRCAVSSLTAC